MIRIEFASAIPKGVKKQTLEAGFAHFSKKFRLKNAEVGLSFVTPSRMRSLNRVFRGKDRETDVLSFEPGGGRNGAAGREQRGYLGDIIISPSYAKKEAKRRGMDPEEEMIRLFIHGLLHLKGYDHATEAEEARMFTTQEQLIEKTMER